MKESLKQIDLKNFKPKIKWIKKAKMWVKITILGGKINHEWFIEKPES